MQALAQMAAQSTTSVDQILAENMSDRAVLQNFTSSVNRSNRARFGTHVDIELWTINPVFLEIANRDRFVPF